MVVRNLLSPSLSPPATPSHPPTTGPPPAAPVRLDVVSITLFGRRIPCSNHTPALTVSLSRSRLVLTALPVRLDVAGASVPVRLDVAGPRLHEPGLIRLILGSWSYSLRPHSVFNSKVSLLSSAIYDTVLRWVNRAPKLIFV